MKNINSQLFDNEHIECYQFHTKKALLAVIADFIEKRITQELYIYCPADIKKVFTYFVSQYKEIKAGGGLVQNVYDEYLFIFRKGYWDLPKGKKDWDEAIKSCAIREVEEETGIDNIKISKKLPDTFHVYTEKNKQIIKHCYWYLMKTTTEKKPEPQLMEEITKAVWLKKDEIPEVLKNTYPSINYLVSNYLMKVK